MYNNEELHEQGFLPTRYYNQTNGKTAQENYRKAKARKKKKDESFMMYMLETLLQASL